MYFLFICIGKFMHIRNFCEDNPIALIKVGLIANFGTSVVISNKVFKGTSHIEHQSFHLIEFQCALFVVRYRTSASQPFLEVRAREIDM